MIDIMFGDPELNDWSKKFLESVARQGWLKNYSPKQKAVIEKLYHQQQKKYQKTSEKRGELQCISSFKSHKKSKTVYSA